MGDATSHDRTRQAETQNRLAALSEQSGTFLTRLESLESKRCYPIRPRTGTGGSSSTSGSSCPRCSTSHVFRYAKTDLYPSEVLASHGKLNEEPAAWLCQCGQFFVASLTPDIQKASFAAVFLRENAAPWCRMQVQAADSQGRQPILSWAQFQEQLPKHCERPITEESNIILNFYQVLNHHLKLTTGYLLLR